MEAQLHKLKVTELKDLLAKHSLTQTGKKDDLVKRLLDNNITLEASHEEEELVDLEDIEEAKPAESTAPTTSAPAVEASAPSSTAPSAPAPETESKTSDAAADLTPEQHAKKARAERFGIPFNPNAASTPRQTTKVAPTSKAEAPASTSKKDTPAEPKVKAGSIDKSSLGLSEEVLAKRAAKFGIPEKKAESSPATTAPAPTAAAKPTKKAEAEITPEMAEKIKIEEEKKRKRAEKFGIAKPVENGTNATEPDSKKAKA